MRKTRHPKGSLTEYNGTNGAVIRKIYPKTNATNVYTTETRRISFVVAKRRFNGRLRIAS